MESGWLVRQGGWLTRLHWRHRGAWLWPVFVATVVADAIIGHALPPAGESQSVAAAAIAGLVLNVVGVLLLSRPLGALLKRARPDLPSVVTRNYGGTATVLAVTAALLIAGIVHA